MCVQKLFVNQKGKPLTRMQCPIFKKKPGMWLVLGTSVTHVVCCHWMHIIKYLICIFVSHWLKNNNQSSLWATMMKLGMWVVLDTIISHGFCCWWWAYILSTSLVYSDWVITTKSNIQNSIWATVTNLSMWIVLDLGKKLILTSAQFYLLLSHKFILEQKKVYILPLRDIIF